MEVFDQLRYHPENAVSSIQKLDSSIINCKDTGGYSLLHVAVSRGNVHAVIELLKRGCDPNIQDLDGATPLHYCVVYVNIPAAKCLLEMGASPDILDRHGNSVIWTATFEAREKLTATFQSKERYDMLKMLLQFCSANSITRQNIYGMSPVTFARQIGDSKLVHILEEAGNTVGER